MVSLHILNSEVNIWIKFELEPEGSFKLDIRNWGSVSIVKYSFTGLNKLPRNGTMRISDIKAERMQKERYLVNRSICISHRWGRATGRWRGDLTVGSLLPRLLSDRGEERVTATSSHLPQEKQTPEHRKKIGYLILGLLRLRSKQEK